MLLASLATAAIGVLIETTLLRRIYRAPELFQLLATFGVVLIVQDLTLLLWGPNDLALPRPRWLRAAVELGDTRFPVFDLVLIGIGPLVLALLWLLFTRTRWGTLVRAATLDREMVAALGVDQRWLFTSVFALGAGLAGLGGALSLPSGSANLGIDLTVITDAFVVVVVGGLGSLPGAYLAALLIALLQSFGLALVPKATLVLVFAVMAAVLVLRPARPARPAADARARRHRQRCRGSPGAADAAMARRRGAAAGRVGAARIGSVRAERADGGVHPRAVRRQPARHDGPGRHAELRPRRLVRHRRLCGRAAGAAPCRWRPGLAAAPVAAGIAALLLGAVVVRLSGVYLAMLTLAFAQIVWAVAFQSVEWTGGDNGILGVRPPAWAR